METLTIQPPLLGESAAIDGLREFIVAASLGPEPVLLTGPPGSGKTLMAAKIHAIGHRSGTPCCSVEGAALTVDEVESLYRHDPESEGPGGLYIRNVERLAVETAQALRERVVHGHLGPRLLTSSQARLGSPAWRSLDEIGLLACLLRRHHEVPGLQERPEDVPVLCRYQVWLHTLPDSFDERWARFEREELPELMRAHWSGNVAELIERVRLHCGADARAPRRWVGDRGRFTAQEEYVRRCLDEAFEEVRALLEEGELTRGGWILPVVPRPHEQD